MTASLYERLGGDAAVHAAVDIFYQKILADPEINVFFDHIDMDKQMRKQRAFLTYAFGGPNHYTGQGLRNAHSRLVKEFNLKDEHFDKVLNHLDDTLRSLKVPVHMVEEVHAIAESTRKDIMNR